VAFDGWPIKGVSSPSVKSPKY